MASDVSRAVSCGFDKTVRVWTKEGKEEFCAKHKARVRVCTFAGDLVLSGCKSEVYLWSISARDPKAIFLVGSSMEVEALAFTEASFFVGGTDCVGSWWDLERGCNLPSCTQKVAAPQQKFEGHTATITSVLPMHSALSEDKWLTTSLDRTCKLWERTAAKESITITTEAPLRCSCSWDRLLALGITLFKCSLSERIARQNPFNL